MKKKFIYIATLICGLFLTSSCDDMLDTDSLSTDGLSYVCSIQRMHAKWYPMFTHISVKIHTLHVWAQTGCKTLM